MLIFEDGLIPDDKIDDIFRFIESTPATLHYDFGEMEGLKVVTSSDGNVRGYVIDTSGFQGNPSRGYDTKTMLQYRIGDSVYTSMLPDEYSTLHYIAKISDDKYLFINTHNDVSNGVQNYNEAMVFEIKNNGMSQLRRAFHFGDRRSDKLEIYWNNGYWRCDDREILSQFDLDDINDLILSYNPHDKTLYAANTTSYIDNDCNSEYYLDGTYNRYQWNGAVFENSTIMKPRNIRNQDYYICIEQSSDGELWYRCWNGGKKKGKPTLTIRNGKREIWDDKETHDYNKWISFDEYKPLGEKYTFKNNGYRYQYMSGWLRGRTYEDLEVYDPKGELLYSGRFEPAD